METITSLLHNAAQDLIPVVVLLGLLIFVHELGHFLVAKFCKVRVEVFSLGFGPKIFKFKRGDTVYAISAIPLGGYVKMFGDDPTAEISSDQKRFSFIHKPVGQRIAVVLAGPLMNFFFAIVLFAGVAYLGEQVPAPKVGDIEATSAAYQAGFRSGDTVLSVGSETVKTWDQLERQIQGDAGKTVSVAVKREGGGQENLQVTPKLVDNKNPLSWDRHVGDVDGLTYSSRSSIIGIDAPTSIAGKSGLKTGDMVEVVNGQKITRWRELEEALAGNSPELASGRLTIEVERGLLDDKKDNFPTGTPDTKVTLEIPAAARGKPADVILHSLGIENPELFLGGIEKDSPAAAAGLQKGDRLQSINGQDVHSFEQVASIVHSYNDAAPLKVVALRDGKAVDFSLSPDMKERMNQEGREEKHFEIGIHPLIIDALPTMTNLVAGNPAAALTRGFTQSVRWSSLTLLSFVRLVQREVSSKNIGGLFAIGQMAKKSWQIGLPQFLNMMAVISINLFILNLFPVPVLDGGHLVFYSIEVIRGAPLSMRKMEIAQQVGLVLLLSLMVFAMYNDVSRIFFHSF